MRKIGPLVQSGDKYCFRCKSVKTTGEFYRHRNSRDGLSTQCKPCVTATQAQSRLAKVRLQATLEFITARNGSGMIELPTVLAGMAL